MKPSFGRSIRWTNPLSTEIDFSRKHGFDFMQVWYKDGTIVLDSETGSKEAAIRQCGYPFVIHALLEVNQFDEHVPILISKLKYLEHREVIIHPVSNTEPITPKTMPRLSKKVYEAYEKLHKNGIQLFLENNSKLDPLNYTPEEVGSIFANCPGLEFLLDIAHVDNNDHLEALISVKYPKYLHISDKHFSKIHEHLPIGKGEIDWDYVFGTALKGYTGKIIFETPHSDEEIIESKRVIDLVFEKNEIAQHDPKSGTGIPKLQVN